MSIPAGAFDDCAKLETAAMKRPDGKDATAFASRAKSLKAMRDVLNSGGGEAGSLLASIDAKLSELLSRPW